MEISQSERKHEQRKISDASASYAHNSIQPRKKKEERKLFWGIHKMKMVYDEITGERISTYQSVFLFSIM